MKTRQEILLGLAAFLSAAALVLSGCQPPKSEPVRPVKIAEGEAVEFQDPYRVQEKFLMVQHAK